MKKILHVTIYLKPLIYKDSEICSAYYNVFPEDSSYEIVNGTLFGPEEELENPVGDTICRMICEDSTFLIKECGFDIMEVSTHIDAAKYRKSIIYGLNNTKCRKIIVDVRVSKSAFDSTFPEELKKESLAYLTMDKVMDGSATAKGIDFTIEKVTVGLRRYLTWMDACYKGILRHIRRDKRK